MSNKIITIFNEYFKHNFRIIKLKHNSKEPLLKWKQNWIKDIKDINLSQHNVGIICDKIIVFDADTVEAITFLEQFDEFRETATVITRKGKHFYFLKSEPYTAKTEKLYKNEIKIDIKADHSYVVAPPSSIDEHVYTFERELTNIKTLTFDEYEKLVYKIKDKLNIITKQEREIIKDIIEDKKIDLSKLKEILKKHYEQGKRQDIVLYTSALLRKNNIDKETCEKFITELCFESGDKDIRQRLSAVDATYEKSEKSELKGFSGLVELGFDERELNSVFENDDEYEHIFDDFYMKDNILFERLDTKKSVLYIMIGPAIFIETILYNTDGYVEYELKHKNKVFKIKSIKDIAEIENRSGIAVVKEKRFLEYLNKSVIQCKQERKLLTTVGWSENLTEFYHPANAAGLWRHILYDKKAYISTQDDYFIKHIKDILTEAKLTAIVYLFSISAIMNKIINTNPSCMIITGLAGTGKTTVSKIACNIYYDTEKFELTMNATQTAIERIMSSMKDMTLLFDEVALKTSSSELEKLIFMTYSKTSKARSDKRLNINLSELNTNLIITSEMSEQGELKRTGALRRMLYLSSSSKDDFTSDFSQLIKALKYKICFHYFVDFIKKIKNSNEFKSIIDFAERNANSCFDLYSIVKSMFATVKMLELFYENDFKQLKNNLSDILLKQELQINERKDITNYFINKFIEFITINQNKFINNNISFCETKNELWGKLDDDHVYIITTKFNEFCKLNDFHTELILKDLEKNNLLARQNQRDRSYTTRILNMLTRTYKIKIEQKN